MASSPLTTAGPSLHRRPAAAFYAKFSFSRGSWSRLLGPPCDRRLILKRHTQYDQLNQLLGPIIILSQLGHDAVYRTGILQGQSAPEGISQHLRCEVSYEQILALEQRRLEA